MYSPSFWYSVTDHNDYVSPLRVHVLVRHVYVTASCMNLVLAMIIFTCLFDHRPLAYSTLADLVHHVRHSLSLNDLSLAVTLFSKNVHDETLPSSIQTMSCKLLLNLVECIRSKSEQENGNVRHVTSGRAAAAVTGAPGTYSHALMCTLSPVFSPR